MQTKIYLQILSFALCLKFSFSQLEKNEKANIDSVSLENDIIDIAMPKVRPTKDDNYLCTSKMVSGLGTKYIYKFIPNANISRAHHMILFACDDVEPELLNQGYWECAHHYRSCKNQRTLYAWGKNAPPTKLPDDVGFRIGLQANISYLILQVHYAHSIPEGTVDESGFRLFVSSHEPRYLAGIMLLLSRNGVTIPANTAKTHSDVNCVLKTKDPIVPFSYRVHTHRWGVVVSGYYISYGHYIFQQLAKGNPQWPQEFYPMKSKVVIKPKDLIAARCTYNTTGYNKDTQVGLTTGNEMCNLYLMFYTQSRNPHDHFIPCIDEEFKNVNQALPPDSDVPLPKNVTLEEYAGGNTYSNATQSKKEHVEMQMEMREQPSKNFQTDGITNIFLENKNNSQLASSGFLFNSDYNVDENWPQSDVKFGQASGVDIDLDGNVVIFHRGDRIWDYNSFDSKNNFRDKANGPITSDTIFVVHSTTGKIIHQWGKNLFYMPHDITVAPNGDTFVTDVALHQVFKFKTGNTNPLLTLGEAFAPGNDDTHFCKPAAVAVTISGDFFVADGYCNSRIMKFDSKGRKLLEWGHAFNPTSVKIEPPPSTFAIPHALALAEDQDLLCVADRENGRIQCFSASEGKLKFMINSPMFGGRLFSVAYSSLNGGSLVAVNGNGRQKNVKVQGFYIPLNTKQISSVFSPHNEGFGIPHDITINKNGSQIYVVEIFPPYKVWKFNQTVPISANIVNQNQVQNISESTMKDDFSLSNSLIIIEFLMFPLILLVAVGVLLKMRSNAYIENSGFKKLRTDEESDCENSDSDIDEFIKSNKIEDLNT